VKIHLENVNTNSTSGPNSFATRLIAELASKGHSIVDTYKQSDVSCVFIQSNSYIPESHPTVHRLDGIWFKPEQFNTHNVHIKKNYLESTRVIWQSKFDKNMTEYHWGVRPGSVINNGIHIKKVVAANNQICQIRQDYDTIFTCSANWHPQKRLRKNIEAFARISQKISGKSALIVMGSSPDVVVNNPDIFYTGSVPHHICLEIFSVSDWMIHLAWLDHCPNTVVEALSQNCPIICTDSGGTHEIVGRSGVVIPENNVYNFELADYDNPYEIDLSALDSFDWTTRPTIINEHLDISAVTDKYIKEFEDAIRESI